MLKRITLLLFLASLVNVGMAAGETKLPKPTPKGVKLQLPEGHLLAPVPGAGKSSVRFKWNKGTNIMVCQGSNACIRRPLPKAIGKPISVIRMPLIDEKVATVSALVVSKDRYSLCYLKSTKADAKTQCVPIVTPFIPGAKIRAITYPTKGTLLSITIDTKKVKLVSDSQVASAIVAFNKALKEAQAKATNVAAKSYSSPLLPMPTLIDDSGGDWSDEGGGDWGGGWGDSGSDYWPEEPFDEGGWGETTYDEGGSDWGNDSGDWDYPSDDAWPEEYPDAGGGGGDDQAIPVPIFPFPPGPTTTPDGGTSNCFITPIGGECHITAPPVVDPNRIDPDTGIVLPPAKPPEGDWSWCDLPIIGWFCGGEPDPVLPGQPSLPPFQWPTRPDAAEPTPRFGEGYEEALDKCDQDLEFADAVCSARYAVMGGRVIPPQKERDQK